MTYDAASLTRRTVYLPHMAGDMTGIAGAMLDSPEMAGDIYSASRPHDALSTGLIWSIACYASLMRCEIHLTWQVIYTKRR